MVKSGRELELGSWGAGALEEAPELSG